MKQFILLLIFLFGSYCLAKRSEKLECNRREIARRDCRLQLGSTQVNAYQNRWRVNNQKWIEVNDLPLVDNGVVWQQMKLMKVTGRTLLEVRLWTPAKGEANLEALNWYLYDLSQNVPQLKAQSVVQFRRAKSEKRQPASLPEYQYQKPEVVKIESAHGKVRWQVGRNHGEF